MMGFLSHDCKLDQVTIQGTLMGNQYIDNVLQPVDIPHFDSHALTSRPVYMDENIRPHCSHAVLAHLQTNAVMTLPLSIRSMDLNPLEDIWYPIG